MVTIEITNIEQRRNDDEEVETYVVEYRIPGYPNTYRTDPIPADEFDDELASERVAQEASPLISGTITDVKLPNETKDDPDESDRRNLLKYGAAALLGIGIIAGGGTVFAGSGMLSDSSNERTASTRSPTDTPTPSPTPTSTPTPTDSPSQTETSAPSSQLFHDDFQSDNYQNNWRFKPGHENVADVSVENSHLVHSVGHPSDNNGGNLISEDTFEATGVKRISAKMRPKTTEYGQFGFGVSFGESGTNGIAHIEENNKQNGFLFRGSSKSIIDSNQTELTSIREYSLTIDFDQLNVTQVERGNSLYELNASIEASDDIFVLEIATGRNRTVYFDNVVIENV